ncbi:hypothetical protein BY458DRAFT_487445 [Sporodiniella umbellata]|nr:hypothetical protein BY458DRAFT_487445 [Sporodiniella umbellata]
MRTLTAEINTLTKSAADERKRKEELESEWKSKYDNAEKSHKDRLDRLAHKLESTLDEDLRNNQPAIHDSLDSYLSSFEKRFSKKKQTTQENLQDAVESSLKAILNDPENGKVEHSSKLPSSLVLTFEQLRNTLVNLQSTVKNNLSGAEELEKDLKRQITQISMSNNDMIEEKENLRLEHEEIQNQAKSLEKELAETKSQLLETEKKRESLNKEHQSLLGKLSHIKETLTPRLEQDKQLREKIAELTNELEVSSTLLQENEDRIQTFEREYTEEKERLERVIENVTNQLEQTQKKCEEYEAITTDLDIQCGGIQEQLQKTQTELEVLKTKTATERLERESEKTSLVNLQTVLEEFQATKESEMQAAVGHVQQQLDVAKRSWKEYEKRAIEAEDSLEKFKNSQGKAEKCEREVKEKTLLIGKLRHEAIILNEHLVEAMRKLKEETSEDSVDRQLITNLLVGFLNAPRGDRKKFDILSIISNVLRLNEEEKEKIGLSRPKQSLGLPVAADDPSPESFTDAWISFLLKESNPLRRNRSAIALSNTENPIDL